IVAGLENQKTSPDAWPVLLDTRGFLTEGSGSNIFLVHDGKVRTPKAQYVLAGVSRAVTMDLCRAQGIEIAEDDLAPYDAATADEAFITSTSLCLCPLRSFNGRAIGNGTVPGPVTAKLIAAYKAEVGADYVAQYLQHL
ncbi:MAG: aminotransferase class IV, partial [Alphaproteobacteria bacterium]|nr:aminotransferase class IV [Alphaproteobacteria bacterium]